MSPNRGPLIETGVRELRRTFIVDLEAQAESMGIMYKVPEGTDL